MTPIARGPKMSPHTFFRKGNGSLAELKRTELSVKQERAILVGVLLPKSSADPRDPLGELASLAKTAGAKVVGKVVQHRHRVDAGLYIGSGKAEEIAHLAAKEEADVIIFDNDLSPSQIGGLATLINKTPPPPRTAGPKPPTKKPPPPPAGPASKSSTPPNSSPTTSPPAPKPKRPNS